MLCNLARTPHILAHTIYLVSWALFTSNANIFPHTTKKKRWYFEVVGDSRCPIVDTWWQTETGAHMISPMPTKGWGLKPGSASLPSFGVQPALLDPQGKELPESDGPAEGLLAVKAPWPSALRGVWGDSKRFEETYFPFKGYYLTGDGARRDEDG